MIGHLFAFLAIWLVVSIVLGIVLGKFIQHGER